jgi:hypothetical protein
VLFFPAMKPDDPNKYKEEEEEEEKKIANEILK